VSRYAIRSLVVVAVAVAIALSFAAGAYADNFLWHDGSVVAPGEGNPLGNQHTETSPIPGGDQAVWYNHPFTFFDFYLADSSDPDTHYGIDEGSSVRVFPGGDVRQSFDNTVSVTQEGLYSIDATAVASAPTTFSAGFLAGLDRTRPNAWSDALPVYDGNAAVTLFASDTLSGVEYIAYQLDNAPVDELIAGQPLFVSRTRRVAVVAPGVPVSAGPGSHVLTFWALDNAGNFGARTTIRFAVNALGYRPVLSKPLVHVRSNHLVQFKGTVTAAATVRSVRLEIQRKRSGKYRPYAGFSVPLAPYVSSYAYTGGLPRGTFRVRATQGSGASGWSTFVVR
jgi:hypothetical protein